MSRIADLLAKRARIRQMAAEYADDDNEPTPTLLTATSQRPALSDEDIRARLLLDDRDRPRACGANVELILRESSELRGRLRFNELTKAIEVTDGRFAAERPNGLIESLVVWLETEWAVFAAPTTVGAHLLHVARAVGSYDPVGEYLLALKWDGGDRIDTWLETYCRAAPLDKPDDADAYGEGVDVRRYLRMVGRRWLIGAVARALDPGCKMDTVLVLEGRQGLKKSMALRVLGTPWFSDTPFAIGEKDGMMVAGATWICELGELAPIIRSTSAAQKNFLSAQDDLYRPPYGRAPEHFPRRCVFAGTVNPEEGEVDYLTDETGHRRWWPVRVGAEIDIAALRRDRDQLWAEAVHYYQRARERSTGLDEADGERYRWWLTPDEQEVANNVTAIREPENPLVDLIHRWWSARLRAADAQKVAVRDVDVFTFALADVAQALHRDAERDGKVIGKALRKAGFRKGQVGPKNARRRAWVGPSPRA